MNTHTKKLFDRALDQAVPGTWTQLSHEQMIKLSTVFAELIVADCLKQIKDGLVDESELLYEHEETTECVNEALMDAHHNIALHFGFAEHFGVEE